MSSSQAPYSVTPVSPEQVHRAAQVLALSFVGDALLLWPMRSDIDAYTGALIQLEPLARGYAEIGVLWACDDVTGVVGWVPPTLGDQVGAIVEATADELSSVFDDDGVRYAAQGGWIAEHVPSEPVWYLEIIGVDPAVQGRGIGTALIQHGMERAQADGLPAFLETSVEGNVAYYERLGFRVVEEGDAPLGGPHVWFMRRDPIN